MKVTLIQGAFLPVPPIMGGACEKIWLRMGQEFASAGHNVVHISRTHAELPEEERIESVKHIRVRGYETPVSLLKLKLLDLFYSRRACRAVPLDSDVVVTNSFWSPLLLPVQLRRKAYIDVQRMPRGQMRLYRRARLRANSAPVAVAIRRELPAEDHDRVVMIPNPLPFCANEPYDDREKQPLLLYCGRVHPEKGLHLLIRAVQMLDASWPLRIVGSWQTEEGGGGTAYKQKLTQASQGLPVTFAGPVHDTELLNEEYRAASVFIYPSLAEGRETFGSAPLESMAWGCVPVVSDLDCFKDFVRSGENGITFDHRGTNAARNLAESIRLLMANGTRRRCLAHHALEVRNTHSPKTIARMFLDDFASIAHCRSH
jgi:glycosyltransferase involved in cell wall biosynthesis